MIATLPDMPADLGEAGGPVAGDELGRHSGVYLGGVNWSGDGAPAGDPDGAAVFDGVEARLEIPYSPTLNPSRFSVEFWAQVGRGTGFRGVLGAGTLVPPAGYGFFLAEDGGWEFWTARMEAPDWDGLRGGSSAPGRWVQVVGTYDGRVKRLYLDGGVSAGRQTSYRANSSGVLRIGAGVHGGGLGTGFEGLVDEVQVYDRALTPVEVLSHYSAGVAADRLLARLIGGEVILVWGEGVLEVAIDPAGPWRELVGARGPWRTSPADGGQFFRVRPGR